MLEHEEDVEIALKEMKQLKLNKWLSIPLEQRLVMISNAIKKYGVSK